ncbi:MAG: VPDSG-CTERM sorting domain-containing protein [Akkermansiaceae bacterium]|nr:VPDSG-CTERM sorting domain-containing protein [Akkermansiaceae bacterium]
MNFKHLSVFGLSTLFALGAAATPLNLSPGGEIASGSGNPSQSDIEGILTGLGIEIPPHFHELYRDEADPPGESGSYASSYTTTYNPDASSAEGFEIRYVGSGEVMTGAQFLLVKGPNGGRKSDPASPAWYLFDIRGWDGDENGDMPIIGSGFWAGGGGAVSHLRIIGVPDRGATVALFGMALLGMAGVRRMIGCRKG